MLRAEEFVVLGMGPVEQLAATCPPCLGPTVGITSPAVPDIVVCLDGNFQQRRHMAASVKIDGRTLETPELFLDPKRVEQMANEIRPKQKAAGDDEQVVRCHIPCMVETSSLTETQ